MPTLAALIDAYEHPGRQVGEFCKRGHERAVYERRYGSRRSTIRVCLACQRAREKQERTQRAEDRRTFALRPHPDALLWDAFCRDIEGRIHAVRAEQADTVCSTCGSTTPEVVDRKWCPRCQALLSVERFSRDRVRSDGRHPICKSCESKRGKAYRTKRALGRSA
jgi:hypothetical protein